eukprot:scaffold14896_cov111-Isochrysis_galbana.AAC.5
MAQRLLDEPKPPLLRRQRPTPRLFLQLGGRDAIGFRMLVQPRRLLSQTQVNLGGARAQQGVSVVHAVQPIQQQRECCIGAFWVVGV